MLIKQQQKNSKEAFRKRLKENIFQRKHYCRLQRFCCRHGFLLSLGNTCIIVLNCQILLYHSFFKSCFQCSFACYVAVVCNLPIYSLLAQVSPEDHLLVKVCIQSHCVPLLFYYLSVFFPLQTQTTNVTAVSEDQAWLLT